VRLAAALAPSAEETARHRAAFDGVGRLLNAAFPGARLSLFGSAANGLGVGGANDIDVSLALPGLEDTREAKGARI
jgi:DNA polymerase sigma